MRRGREGKRREERGRGVRRGREGKRREERKGGEEA